MNTDQFKAVVNSRIASIEEVLEAKADEYAHGDRLSNFKRAASIQRTSPEQALMGMFMKHLVSVIDYVEYIGMYGSTDDRVNFDEKVGDSINYLILLEALIFERGIQEIALDPLKKHSKKK